MDGAVSWGGVHKQHARGPSQRPEILGAAFTDTAVRKAVDAASAVRSPPKGLTDGTDARVGPG